MNRYRVHIVPRAGRYPPVPTVLVEADSPDEASRTAAASCAGSKIISAEDVDERRSGAGLRMGPHSAPPASFAVTSDRATMASVLVRARSVARRGPMTRGVGSDAGAFPGDRTRRAPSPCCSRSTEKSPFIRCPLKAE
jgi:hypothetical protein